MTRQVYPQIGTTQCAIILEWSVFHKPSPVLSAPQALAQELRLRGCTLSSELTSGLVTLSHWECKQSARQ
jgi:hypothetical protein